MPKLPPDNARQPVEQTIDDPSTWENDQKNRGYYYDDSHGYETYVPSTDDEDCDADDIEQKEKGMPTK